MHIGVDPRIVMEGRGEDGMENVNGDHNVCMRSIVVPRYKAHFDVWNH